MYKKVIMHRIENFVSERCVCIIFLGRGNSSLSLAELFGPGCAGLALKSSATKRTCFNHAATADPSLFQKKKMIHTGCN